MTPRAGTRAARLSAARGWIHDRQCMGYCARGDCDHARRTQGDFARAAVDAATVDDLARIIHEKLCGWAKDEGLQSLGYRCDVPRHTAAIASAATVRALAKELGIASCVVHDSTLG